MAFVIKRPGDRWELRESWASPAGPRARTLASFRLLTPEVAARAVKRSTTELSVDALMQTARAAGAPVADTRAEEVARELVALLSAGAVLPGVLRQQLEAAFEGGSAVAGPDDETDVPETAQPQDSRTGRERIISAALECFRMAGVRQTRMADIADHAGIARPNLYRHFPSRRALLLQAVVTEARSTHARRLAQRPIEGPAADLLTDTLMLGHATAVNDDFIRLLIEEIPRVTADLLIKETDILSVELEYWGLVLAHCRDRGELRDDIDDRSIMRWLLFIQFSCLERREFFTTADDLRSYLRSFVVSGLLKHY